MLEYCGDIDICDIQTVLKYLLPCFQNGEVHNVQQVWFIRGGGTARFALYPAVERGEREDLCLPLVLVRHSRLPYLVHTHLSAGADLLTTHACLHDANALSARTPRQYRHHRPQKQVGRLVLTLCSWREPRLGHLPRYHERIRQQAKSQLPASYPRRAGRVTSNPRVGVPHVTNVPAARHGSTSLSCV